jgi:lipoprotein-releasing system permease protein
MSVAWFVARRYLTARRRQTFISLISAVSILGVAVGVMALIVALALMTGVQQELRDRIVGSTAHVYVYKDSSAGPFANDAAERARLSGPGVEGVAPAIVGPGLLTAAGGRERVVQIKGIDPALEPGVTNLTPSMVTGSIGALLGRSETQKDGVVLGEDLAKALGVSVGDVVDLVTSEVTSTLMGLMPRRRPLEVVGTFRFGFYEIDTTTALMSLRTAGEMLNRAGPDMMQLRLTHIDDAPAIRARLHQSLGAGYLVQDWTQLNRELYSALWLEKVAISLTIGLIVMVAALNIVASLVLLVMEKSRDIAILRTMGAPTGTIRRIFIYQGLTIGVIGTTSGALLGLLICFVAEKYKLISLPADVYQITYLPFRVEPMDVMTVVASAMAVCLVATLYPSRQAARIDPAEALRNQ